MCPVCNNGPYDVVDVHVRQMHPEWARTHPTEMEALVRRTLADELQRWPIGPPAR